MKHGVYIHIPYCVRKCDYCGFYSESCGPPSGDGKVPHRFIDGLRREIEERPGGEGRHAADTVYFGGGTPSLLDPDQAATILEALCERFDIAPGAEISMEMNPRDISPEKLSAYRDAGVNRAVLGAQTLSERLHRIIGRSSPPCTARDLELFFSVPGILHCLDLIAGIPTQSEGELRHDIGTAAGFGAAHISLYLLSVEKGTPLAGRLRMDEAAESGQGRLFETARARLLALGYDHYEISNYARPGSESRHNMKYWRFEPYFGFGPGAHSFVEGERYCNAATVSEYIESGSRLTRDERGPASAAVEYIMTGLRILAGFSLGEMEERLGRAVPEPVMDRIRTAADDGTVIIEGGNGDTRIRLSERGLILSDSVIYSLVEHLL